MGPLLLNVKKIIFGMEKFFCLKLPNSSRKPIKKILHFKMSYSSKCKIQNVRVQQHERGAFSVFH